MAATVPSGTRSPVKVNPNRSVPTSSTSSSRGSDATNCLSLNLNSPRTARTTANQTTVLDASRPRQSSRSTPSTPTKTAKARVQHSSASSPSQSKHQTGLNKTSAMVSGARPGSLLYSGALPHSESDLGLDTSFAETDNDDDRDAGQDDDTLAAAADVPRRKAGFGQPQNSVLSREPAVARATSPPDLSDPNDDDNNDGKAVNVVVCLRVRPNSLPAPSPPIYDFQSSSSTISFTSAHPVHLRRGGARDDRDSYEFTFDRLHLAPDPTEHLYDSKIRPIVRSTMRGFNGTVFAYGQTASGKTHTMMGSDEEPGIIPLAVDELFAFIHEQHDHRSFSLRVSFLEIYNEQLRDLLSPAAASLQLGIGRPSAGSRPLEIVGDDGSVKNLAERPVSMPSEVLSLLREGDTRRRVGATDWNERSSRSHAVFMVTIESIDKTTGAARTSRLNLIDLAGSESATGQDERRKEGSFINKSLLTLSTVIGKLSEQAGLGTTGSSRALHAHIPYRDSKLTRLLQPALSGKSRIAVVCTISPLPTHAIESLSTLKFARRASRVVTKAERGVLVTDAMMLKQYELQVAELRAQIEAREREVDDAGASELVRQLGEVAKKADEAESNRRKAEEQLRLQDLELALLRERLSHAQSFILTGPSLEANARRTSSSFSLSSMTPGRTAATSSQSLSSVLSPTRNRRIVSASAGIGSVDELGTFSIAHSSLGLGTPCTAPSRGQTPVPAPPSAPDPALLAELDAARSRIRELEAGLADKTAELQRATELHAEAERHDQMRAHALQIDLDARDTVERDLRQELDSRQKKQDELESQITRQATGTSEQLQQLQDAQVDLARARNELAEQAQEHGKALADRDTMIAARDNAIAIRDDRVSSLERQMQSLTDEMASLRLTHLAELEAARDESAAAHAQVALAHRSAEEAQARIGQVEELARLEQERHDLALADAAKERSAAHSALQADVTRLRAEVEAKDARCTHLQRLVDAAAKLEQDQRTYASNQRAGTDALQARLESLRSGNRHAPSAAAVSRPGSALSTRASIESSATSVGESEWRIKLQESQASADEYKRKWLASQKLLDKLTEMGSSPVTAPVTRSTLSELNGPLGDATSATASSNVRPSSTRTASSFSSSSSVGTTATIPGKPPGPPSSSYYPQDRPPPLPYSPRNKDKERKHRRVTTAHDIEKLKEVRAVDKARELFDSPRGTSTTVNDSRGLRSPGKQSWE